MIATLQKKTFPCGIRLSLKKPINNRVYVTFLKIFPSSICFVGNWGKNIPRHFIYVEYDIFNVENYVKKIVGGSTQRQRKNVVSSSNVDGYRFTTSFKFFALLPFLGWAS